MTAPYGLSLYSDAMLKERIAYLEKELRGPNAFGKSDQLHELQALQKEMKHRSSATYIAAQERKRGR